MAKKTILRKANTQEIANVNEDYINMAEWTGLNDSTNYTSVDQSSFSEADNVYVDDENELRNRPPILSTQPFETIECNDLEDNTYVRKINKGTTGETIYEAKNSHGSATVLYTEPESLFGTWYDAYDNTGAGTYDKDYNLISVLINEYKFTDIDSDKHTCTLTYTADCYGKPAPQYIRNNNNDVDTYYNVTKIIIESTTGLLGELQYGTDGPFDTCYYVTELDVNCYVDGFSTNNMVFSGLGINSSGVNVYFNGTRLQYSSEIPQYCFYSTNSNYVTPNLKSITFNGDIRIIGQYAFAYTTLTSLTLPSTIEQVNLRAFNNVNTLKTLVIEGPAIVNDYAFCNDTALTTVSGNGACGFANYCFYSCTALTTVTLPNAIDFGQYCFYECNKLVSISANSATLCDDYCFYMCESLTTVELASVTEVGKYCFYECTLLNTNSYDSLSTINEYAFYHNLALTAITIGAPRTIDRYAFSNCINLVTITVPSRQEFTIGSHAFNECFVLETIKTWNSSYPTPYVTSIGERAFMNCYELNSLDLDYVSSIDTEAFYNCYKLEELTLTNILTLADEAFGYSSLVKVNIGNTLTTVGTHIFEGVTTLEELDIPFIGPDAGIRTSSQDTLLGYLFSSANATGINIVTQTIDGTSTYISYIPASLKTVQLKIGTQEYASRTYNCILAGTFSGCNMLDLIVIGDDSYPDNIHTINDYAFYNCTGLTMIALGHSVTTIYFNVFTNCTNLNTIFIPKSMNTFAADTFAGCNSIPNVYYEGSQTDMQSIAFNTGNVAITGSTWIYNYEYEV